MHQPTSSSFFFCILPFFFIIFSIKSSSIYGAHLSDYCNTTTCGTVEVRYPFWRRDIAPPSFPYCGYPGFGIDCSPSEPKPNPIIHLRSDDFYVKEIDYENSTLLLVDIDVTRNPNCPRAERNLTLEDLSLYYSEQDLNLTFYFNCTSPLPPLPSTYQVDCLSSDGKVSYLSLAGNETQASAWFGTCEEKVVATVMERDGGGMNGWPSRFGRAMNDGFVLHWANARDCAGCEESNGHCGYNVTDKFMCFCKDGTITNDDCKGRGLNVKLKVLIGFAAAGGSAILMCIVFFFYQRRKKRRHSASTLISRSISSYPSSVSDPEKGGSYFGVHIFTYDELEDATNNFDSNKVLGDGGFGTVYKGELRDGRIVAVKRLYENNFKRVEQFMNEVEILTHLRHQHLVSLYGCTSRHSRELLLVYEYIPNGTVACHLHGHLARPKSLSWTTRMNIAIETASALAFLHASDVIHRDVKTNNILLDNNFCVKVADFGLSRLFPTDATHISTAPQGTPGYVDPEYHECYHLTDKSDVYSFGVVLIELISSKPAVDITRHRHEINLSNMAINKIQNHALHDLVDPDLGFVSDYKVRKMITAVAELAFQCLQYGRDLRPSMHKALKVLLEIQSQDYSTGMADGIEIPAEDVGSLKSNRLTCSPESLIADWNSRSTTSSASC